MAATDPSLARAGGLGARSRSAGDRLGDRLFRLVALGAVLGALAVVALLAYEVFDLAWPSIERFGLGFLGDRVWNPVTSRFGALEFIVGTAITSLGALLLAAPIALAIALFLTELAPQRLRTPVAALVEVLAGIPSVVVGLWGILVLGPFLRDHVQPALGDALGFVPLFSGSPNASSMFTAIVVLTIMIVPIVTAISRELFLRVPLDQKQGALALGATRWEMVRGVMIPNSRAGIAAALILGLGRAVGEAIAVTQVIGGNAGIHWSLFAGADTLASRIAAQYQGASTSLQVASLGYLAAILLVLALLMNLAAQLIVRRMAGR